MPIRLVSESLKQIFVRDILLSLFHFNDLGASSTTCHHYRGTRKEIAWYDGRVENIEN